MNGLVKSLNVESYLNNIFKINKNDKEERKKVFKPYKSLIEEVNKDVKKGLLNINLEEYIKPEGICEGIAYSIGCIGKLKKAQLRKFFNEIKAIEYELKDEGDIDKIKIRILALIPKLAYSKGRNLIDEDFYEFMKTILTQVKNDLGENNPKEVFSIFVSILEAILSYHKYHFPKED